MVLLLVGLCCGCTGASKAPVSEPAGGEVEVEAKQEPVPTLLQIEGVAEVDTQKNGDTPVGATVAGIKGEVNVLNLETWEGLRGEVSVPISSFNTGLELRDERIQDVFFNREAWPDVVLKFAAPAGFSRPLVVGDAQALTVPAEISVGGGEGAVTLELDVALEEDGRYSVTTRTPAVLSIQGLGLSDALAQLVTLCGHESVRDEVRVDIRATVTN
ncbi:MAG: YceI family protein [Myxococcota bacterium]|nr:YceI family protein [Myxococcota bacterium]